MKIKNRFNLSYFFLFFMLGFASNNILYADISIRAEKPDNKKENKKEDFLEAMENTARSAKTKVEESYQKLSDEFKSGKQTIEAGAKKLGEKFGLTSEQYAGSKSEYSTVILSFATSEKTIKIQAQTYQQSSTFIIHVTHKNHDNIGEDEHNSLAELKQIKTYIKKNFIRDFNSRIALTILDQCIQGIGLKQKDKDVNVESSNKNHQQKYIIEIIPHAKQKDYKKDHSLTSFFSFS